MCAPDISLSPGYTVGHLERECLLHLTLRLRRYTFMYTNVNWMLS
jgi:hypothetical protein